MNSLLQTIRHLIKLPYTNHNYVGPIGFFYGIVVLMLPPWAVLEIISVEPFTFARLGGPLVWWGYIGVGITRMGGATCLADIFLLPIWPFARLIK